MTGRTDRCLILGADNIEEYMLDEAVRSEELNQVLTGFYCAKVHYEAGRQYLFLDLEVLKGVDLDKDKFDQIYDSLVEALGRLQPSFREEHKSIHSASDAAPSKRILRLNFLPWPKLSQSAEDNIKQRGINPLPSS
ncbi:MAG: hypothetical protein F6K00_08070 [Leptolyngbya sp. SIOISBB]|nr:hypothetical protein [Leptolyngbya sp. SIOISBB]